MAVIVVECVCLPDFTRATRETSHPARSLSEIGFRLMAEAAHVVRSFSYLNKSVSIILYL